MTQPMMVAATPAQLAQLDRLLDVAEESYERRAGDTVAAHVRGIVASGDGPELIRLMVHQAHEHVMIEFGSWTGFTHATQSLANARSSADTVTNTRVASLLLRQIDRHTDLFEDYLTEASDEVLVIVIAALAGLSAKARRKGRWPVLIDFTAMATPGWTPDPRKFPKWRRWMFDGTRTDALVESVAVALTMNKASVIPANMEPYDAARVLVEAEAQRLARAKLWWMEPASWPVVERKAARPRTLPLAAHRVPSTYGMLFFPAPVESHGTAPIVAASWGPWNSVSDTTPDGHLGLAAARRFPLGEPFADLDTPSWWVTLYTPRALDAPGLPKAPLVWEQERLIAHGVPFAEGTPTPASREWFMRHVVACWELFTQGRGQAAGRPVTDIIPRPRKPVEARRDRRAGIVDDGTVNLVTIGHGRSKPRRESAGGVGAPRGPMEYRELVREHTKQQCPNTRRHAELGDACLHEEVTILEYPRGPEGAPFRLSNTVYQYKDPT